MKLNTYTLIGVIILVGIAIYFVGKIGVERDGSGDAVTVMPRASRVAGLDKSEKYEPAKEITTPDGFINTEGKPITIGEFTGKKVVLIDFWTYSCINCQRTTPYLNAWYEKYKDKGLVIIGVHTPEFEFEKNYENVAAAAEKFGIAFPIVLDNDYSTWRAYKNQYWPRKYLIDIDGYVVYDHIGEGAYEETEREIQKALEERMEVLGEDGEIDDVLTEEERSGGIFGSRSPETYFGAFRNESFGNGEVGIAGFQKNLSVPDRIRANTLYLSGDWNINYEFAGNVSSGAGITYRYTARDVFFVAEAEKEIVVTVTRDGKPLGDDAGADIERTSEGRTIMRIKDARLYRVIKSERSETHTLEFKVEQPGLAAYTFTFG